jgi:hypothetical protein
VKVKATHLVFGTLAMLAAATTPGSARSEFLPVLIEQLHLSATGASRVGCQYCHVSQFGGAPWNKFGTAVRANYNGEAKRDISKALYLTLKADKDSDGDGVNDVLEVVAKTMPGDEKSKPTQTKAALEAELKKLGGVDYFKAK